MLRISPETEKEERERERERERENGENQRRNKNDRMVGLSVFIRVGLVTYPCHISLLRVYQGHAK